MEITFETEKIKKYSFLRQNMITGEDEEFEYKCGSGAGCGNDKITFEVTCKKTGNQVSEFISIMPIFEKWLDEKTNELKNL